MILKNYIRTKLCYNKMDYESIEKELKDIDWEMKLKYKNSLTNMSPAGKSLKARKDKKYHVMKNIKKDKRKTSSKKKSHRNKDPLVRMQYNRIRNQVRRLTRNIAKEYERGLARNAKENPKAIWRYINSKSKTKESIGNLLMTHQSQTQKWLNQTR